MICYSAVMHIRRFVYFIAYFALVVIAAQGECLAGDWQVSRDFGLGAGVNVNSLNTKQVIFIPAVNWHAHENIILRLEGNLEFISDDNVMTAVGGVAPFVRLLTNMWEVNPYVEISGGLNVMSRDQISDRQQGGAFAFSLQGGAGISFDRKGRSYSVSTRFRHLSNGQIYDHNQSFNTQYVLFSTGF